MPKYQIKTEQFEGPLELLLNLIKNSKLDINEISLSQITDEYLEYIDQNQNLNIDEVADFLVIAAKLLYIKSKLIIPEVIKFTDDDTEDLEKQLKIYKEYYDARENLRKIIKNKNFTYSRKIPLSTIKTKFRPPQNINTSNLQNKFKKILKSLKPIITSPTKKTIDKTINIKEKINHIKNLINRNKKLVFSKLILDKKDKTEIIVVFLAMLELIKQKDIAVTQNSIFDDINIYYNE